MTDHPEIPVTVLLVEDDELDVMGVQRTLKSLDTPYRLVVATDGVEGLEYLRGGNGRKKITAPYLVLLDMNMPRMNGLEFLKEIRSDQELKSSIVVIFTTSDNDDEIAKARKIGISEYILKTGQQINAKSQLSIINFYCQKAIFQTELSMDCTLNG